MLFEETDIEGNENSLSDVNSLDDDLGRMQFESSSFEEEVGDDDLDLQV